MSTDRIKNFMKRRDRITIYISILESIMECSSKSATGYAKFTHVMYRSNLSSQRLKERLQELSYLDLITWDNLGIKLTHKGKNFLEEYKNLMIKIEKYIKMRD